MSRLIIPFLTVMMMVGTGIAQDLPEALQPFARSLTTMPAKPGAEAGRTFVPVYSSLMAGGGKTRLDFAATLSIHNTSERDPLVVSRIDYYETSGTLAQAYLSAPIAIRPFGTLQIVVAQDDARGGRGANFVVDWNSTSAGTEPVIEAVMIANVGTQSFSFLSAGRRVARP